MPTPKKRPLVIVTRKLPDPIETRMMELFDTRLNIADKPMSQAELIEAVKSADVLVPTITDRIDGAVLAHAGPNFRLIANFGGCGRDLFEVEIADRDPCAAADQRLGSRPSDPLRTTRYRDNRSLKALIHGRQSNLFGPCRLQT